MIVTTKRWSEAILRYGSTRKPSSTLYENLFTLIINQTYDLGCVMYRGKSQPNSLASPRIWYKETPIVPDYPQMVSEVWVLRYVVITRWHWHQMDFSVNLLEEDLNFMWKNLSIVCNVFFFFCCWSKKENSVCCPNEVIKGLYLT